MRTFRVGERASVTRTFTAADLEAYEALTGDRQGRTDTRGVVPGPLLAGLFSQLLGTSLPGRGTNYLKQRLAFVAHGYAGEEIVATVEVTRVRPEKALVNLDTVCTTTDGRIVCEGEALVLVRDVG